MHPESMLCSRFSYLTGYTSRSTAQKVAHAARRYRHDNRKGRTSSKENEKGVGVDGEHPAANATYV